MVVARMVTFGIFLGTLYMQVTCDDARDHCNVGTPPSCKKIQVSRFFISYKYYSEIY